MNNEFSHKQLSLIKFTLILGSIIINSAMDMHAPVLPEIGSFFQVNETLTQWTVSSYFLGTAIAALFYGPLADCYGRKKLLLIGIFFFTCASVWCAVAHDIYELIIARFFQGVGGISSAVIWLTIIKDIFKGKDSVRTLNVFNITISLSLSAAPIVGSIIADYFGWRCIFLVLSILGLNQIILVSLIIPETLQKKENQNTSVIKAFKNYKFLFSNRDFLVFALLNGMIHGLYVAQIPLFSIHFQDVMKISRESFALYQFVPTFFYVISAAFVRQYVKESGLYFTIRIGMYLILGYVVSLLIVQEFFSDSVNWMVLTYCIYTVCCPFIATVVTTKAMELFHNMGGTSSSAVTSIRQLMASFITFSAAAFYNQTFQSITIVLIIYVAIIFIAFLTHRKQIESH
jgi:DHA1 family bicyclomycin/chloramphenicol resistance-like MFS transporter